MFRAYIHTAAQNQKVKHNRKKVKILQQEKEVIESTNNEQQQNKTIRAKKGDKKRETRLLKV